MVIEIKQRSFEIEKRNTVNISPMQSEDFIMKAPNNQQNGFVKVNVPTYYELNASITNLQVEELPVVNGVIDISQDPDIAYVLTVNRYGKKNSTLGLVRNFGGMEGAIGSTVAHDHHNLMIVYRYPEAASRVYQALKECGGGISCSSEQELLYTLELPVFGLMSAVNCFETAKRATKMKEVLRSVGLDTLNPLLRIVTLGLTVIPEFKYSDLGLVDVMQTKLIPIFPKA